MVNLTSLAIIAEPVATAPAAPARGRIEPGDTGAFAKILARGDGTSADRPTADQDSDLPDETSDSDTTDVLADPTAVTPLDAPVAAIPYDTLTAAMNEGVGAVLALLAAVPTPPTAPAPVTSTPSASGSAMTAIAAATTPTMPTMPTRAAYMPAIVSRAPVATAQADTKADTMPAMVTQPIVAAPEIATTDVDPAVPLAATPGPRQDIPDMLNALRSAFEPAPALAPATPTAGAVPVTTPPAIGPAATSVGASIAPVVVAVTAANAIPEIASPIPADIAPQAIAAPVAQPSTDLRTARPAPVEAAAPEPAALLPAAAQANSNTDPASPADPGEFPDDRTTSPKAADIVSTPSVPVTPTVPAIEPIVIPPAADPAASAVPPEGAATVETSDSQRVSAEPARSQAAAPPIPADPKPAQPNIEPPSAPKPETPHKKVEDAPVIAIDRASNDIGAMPTAPAPVSATAIDAGMATAELPQPQGQQSIARHLDLARDSQWLDQLAQDISQAATRNGHLKFQLNPEHLGSLQVEIVNSAAGTSVRMTADTDAARTIIADAQPRLVAEARAQGLRITETHVDLGGQSGSGGTSGQQPSSEDHKPFVRTQAVVRDEAGDSPARADDERYA